MVNLPDMFVPDRGGRNQLSVLGGRASKFPPGVGSNSCTNWHVSKQESCELKTNNLLKAWSTQVLRPSRIACQCDTTEQIRGVGKKTALTKFMQAPDDVIDALTCLGDLIRGR